MGQEITRLVHEVDPFFAIGNSDMNMQAEDEIGPRDLLHVLHDRRVAFVGGDQLIVPMRKGVRARGSDLQSAAPRQQREFRSQLCDLFARLVNILANLRAQLDDRLVHLRFHVLFQRHPPVIENLLDVRTQLPRFRIDDLEFLFNPKSEDVLFHEN